MSFPFHTYSNRFADGKLGKFPNFRVTLLDVLVGSCWLPKCRIYSFARSFGTHAVDVQVLVFLSLRVKSLAAFGNSEPPQVAGKAVAEEAVLCWRRHIVSSGYWRATLPH